MNRRTLLRGAAAMPIAGQVAAVPTPDHPDAALIALCDHAVALEAEYRRLVDVSCDVQTRPGSTDAEMETAEAAIMALMVHDRDRMDAIAKMPARTAEGLRAKARAVHAFYDPDPPDHSVVDGIMWSVLEVVAGVTA